MKRNIINSIWNRLNRNGINANFEYLFELRGLIEKVVIEDSLTPTEYAELSTLINGLLKSGEVKQDDLANDLNTFLNDLETKSESTLQEIESARGEHTVLGGRLNGIESQLSQTDIILETVSIKLEEIGVNVKSPPLPLQPAYGDGVTDDTDAIKTIIEYCITNGLPVYFPNGVYMVRVISLRIIMDEGKNLKMFGAGKGSIIKVFDGEINTRFSRLFFFDIQSNVEAIEISDLYVDNNARGSTPPSPQNRYEYEQSHTFQVTVGSGYTLREISFNNVTIKDPAADGFNNGGQGVVELYRVINSREVDRTRVRSSIQMSRMPKHLLIDNFVGESIESEAVDQIESGLINITNSTVDILDLDPGLNVTSNLTNVTVNIRTIIHMTKVNINNCSLRLGALGRWDQLHRNSKIYNSEIFIQYNPNDNSITPLNLFNSVDTFETDVTFLNCDFIIDYAGSISPTGFLIVDERAFYSSDTRKNVKKFVGCYFDNRAAGSIKMYRNGKWILENNVYGGTLNALDVSCSTGFKSDVFIRGGDFTNVTGNGFTFIVLGDLKLTLTGDFIGSNAQSFTSASGIRNLNLTNNRNIVTELDVNYGLKGDKVFTSDFTGSNYVGKVCTLSGFSETVVPVWKDFGLLID